MYRYEEFLKELSELTQKYEMRIGGCGCCDSPYLIDFKGNFVGGYLTYYSERQEYLIDIAYISEIEEN